MKILILPFLALAMSPQYSNDKLQDAILQVETGGCKDPAHAVGDNGLAYGWGQMHPDCFRDAQEWARTHSKALPAYRVVCEDKALTKQAIGFYWQRYRCTTPKEKALTWHYGPSGRDGKKNSNDPDGYWNKVQKALTH